MHNKALRDEKLREVCNSIVDFMDDEHKNINILEPGHDGLYRNIQRPMYYGGVECFLQRLESKIVDLRKEWFSSILIIKKRLPIGALKRKRVFERDKYRCVNCNSFKNLAIDHIRAFSKGGTNDIGNLRTLCKKCNSSKRNKHSLTTF